MIGPARRWRERHRVLQSRRPMTRLDRCVATEEAAGVYRVVIDGFALMPAVVPPRIVVGGVPLEDVHFEVGARRITGVLRDRPRDEHVLLDLGYARAEGVLTMP